MFIFVKIKGFVIVYLPMQIEKLTLPRELLDANPDDR